MNCPSCNAENRDGAKFCNECGNPLPKLCASCGQGNPSHAKFCDSCGEPLQAATENKPLGGMDKGELRQITVMFCDVVGFTEISGRLDPEDLREIMQAYRQAAAGVVTRFDGHIAQYLGDGIMAYFGFPHAHEDDPSRAVQSGLDILDAVSTLGAKVRIEYGVRLQIRIGIHTGRVVVGAVGPDGTTLAIGETVNVASRVEAEAKPGSVVVSWATERLLPRHFTRESLGMHTLKGVNEAVELFQVTSARSPEPRIQDEIESVIAKRPLVGRTPEVSFLSKRWQESKTGRGQLVMLRGEAGIGKTRLIWAFRDLLRKEPQEYVWAGCRCSPFYINSALYPLAGLRPILCGASDSAAEQLDELERTLKTLDMSLADTVPLLAPVLGVEVPAERYMPPVLTPQVRRQRTLEALVEVLVRMAARQPMVLAVEDMQWVDRSTLDFLTELEQAIARAPIMMLLTARPEFRAPWPAYASISLTQLSDGEAVSMIHNLTGGKPLPDQILSQILGKAGGNPLFLEELAKMVLESGRLSESEQGFEQSQSKPDISIPSTLQDSLMARLDSIGTAKLVIQMGSIIGREFDFALMQDVLQMDEDLLARELERLIEAQLVYPRGKAPHSTYILKHALIQDAAYNSLTKRTRRSYHERVARVLAQRFSDTAPEVLAHHFTEADLHEQAARYWHQAGQQAMGKWALTEAINHLEHALQVIARRPASLERALSELQVRVTLGGPLMLTKGFAAPEVETNYARVFELCNQCGETAIEQQFWAYWGLWNYYEVRAIYPRAEEIGKRALEVAEQVDDSGMLVGAHAALGAARLMRGALDEARYHFEAGAALYDMEMHAPLAVLFGQDVGAMCMSFLTWVFAHQGDAEALEARARESLALAYELRQPSTQGFVEAVVAAAYNAIGHYDLGEQHARKLIEIADEQGFPHWQAQGRATRGWAVQGRGNVDEAARLIREGIDAYLGTGTRAARTYFNGALIAAEIDRGHLDEARALLDETYAFVDEGDERFYLAELYRLEGRLILAQGGPDAHERARERLLQARALAHEQRAKTFEYRAAHDLRSLDT